MIGAGGGSIAKFNASTKGAVNTVEWNENGRWILAASQDNLIRLWDVRKLEKPLRKLRGHDCAVTSAQWHPHHRELFVSADYHGGMKFWLASLDAPIASVANSKFENGAGHESGVFAMAWHPMGHMLATGSNDNFTKFWRGAAHGMDGGEHCAPAPRARASRPRLAPAPRARASQLIAVVLPTRPTHSRTRSPPGPRSPKKNSHHANRGGSSSAGGGGYKRERPAFQPPPPPNPMGVGAIGAKRSRFGRVGQV